MERFFELNDSIVRAYRMKDYSTAEQLCDEYLKLAPQYKDNWNYGNAIHVANIILGLIAVERNELENAKEFLISAAMTPGSPQLKTFGPNMSLANELLKRGEKEIVLSYLKMCKSFWRWLFRLNKVRKWQKQIKIGKIPNFKGHLLYYLMESPKKQ